MRRACEACGAPYDAKRASARFCSDRCRKRVARGSTPRPQLHVVAPADDEQKPAGSVLASVLIALDEAHAMNTPAGRIAISLATRMDDATAVDSGSAVAALSRELRAVLAEATAKTMHASSPLDAIREGLRVV